MAEEQTSLGQVAYDASCRAEGYDGTWNGAGDYEKRIWEAVGQAVKAAVLAEQERVRAIADRAATLRLIGEQASSAARRHLHEFGAQRELSAGACDVLCGAVGKGVQAALEAWERQNGA